MKWKKSSYSTPQGGNCVETAGDAGTVHVRDTKDRDGETLRFSGAAWRRFTEAVKHA